MLHYPFLLSKEAAMLRTALFCLVTTSLFANASLTHHEGEHVGWISMFSLPQYEIDNRFREVQEQVTQRWKLLGAGYKFPSYSPGRDERSLADEFHAFSRLRIQLWLENHAEFPCQSNPLFKISQEHLLKGRFRQPCCITFEHSATDSSYNSSNIQIGKRRFLALEGPVKEHLPYFFRLLSNWRVAELVCLTNETDGMGMPKCFPYWHNRLVYKGEAQFLRLIVEGAYEQPTTWGTKDLPYLFWPDWEDHHGVEPAQLVQAVNRVRNSVAGGEIIAVHCSAGVGRTGTFIAAICLLDEIDEQLANGVAAEEVQISIAKLFLYLNFHRPWLVAKPSQYVTLYRTVEWYLNQGQAS